MASVKLESIAKQRSFDAIVETTSAFIDTLVLNDIVYSCQIIKVAEKPAEYWGAVIIWFDAL